LFSFVSEDKHSKLKINLLIIILCFQQFLFAQKEGNIWYFGENAGLDFNSGAPVALTDGAIVTREGCASMCNTNGDLLFYTDGITVWDKNHSIMPNGSDLKGDPSSTQSAIIVKKPGLNSIYFIFTVAQIAEVNGLRYSEVDINLNSGLGDVNSSKNILLLSPSCEKVTAIRHQNKTDYWIIAKPFNSINFHSYLLSSSGLTISPIISPVGIKIENTVHTVGYLKASPEGTKVASVNYGQGEIEVFDFDNQSGLLSNSIKLISLNPTNAYGAEFSPNGKLLYISEIPGSIFQFNLIAGSPLDINNSRIEISINPALYGAMQIAPDHKIYIAAEYNNQLSTIEKPNLIGAACDFKENSVSLLGQKSRLGLPTFKNTINDSIPPSNFSVEFEMPNVFTPNGDGSNDIFKPVFSQGIAEMQTIIFNRWGGQVYETNNPNIEWDGGELAEGVYFWVVRYTNVIGDIKTMKGHLTLIR